MPDAARDAALPGTTSLVTVHKVVQLAGAAASVSLIPRLLGAEGFGRFAFLLAVSYLAQILGDLGTLDVLAARVPGMARGDADRLYMRLVAVKVPIGIACGVAAAAATAALAPWAGVALAWLTGAATAIHVVAWVPFQYALATGRVGTWMTDQAWRQWTTLAGVAALAPAYGVTGAMVALLATEAVFLAGGLWTQRHAWRWTAARLEFTAVAPYLRLGVGFWAANLATVALLRSGPVLVEVLTGRSEQTGFLELALAGYIVVHVSVGQYAQALLPTLGAHRARSDDHASRRILLRFGAWCGGLVAAGAAIAWATAPALVPFVVGAEFAGAVPAVRWAAAALPLAVVAWTFGVAATAAGDGAARARATAAALAVFVAWCWVTVPEGAAVAAARGLVAAIAVQAGLLWWSSRTRARSGANATTPL